MVMIEMLIEMVDPTVAVVLGALGANSAAYLTGTGCLASIPIRQDSDRSTFA